MTVNSFIAKDIDELEELAQACGRAGLQLQPLEGQAKSPCNKAKVQVLEEDKARGRYTITLYSYDTPILDYDNLDNAITVRFGGWDATTAQHIRAFMGGYIPKSTLASLKVGNRYSASALLEGRVLGAIAGLVMGYC